MITARPNWAAECPTMEAMAAPSRTCRCQSSGRVMVRLSVIGGDCLALGLRLPALLGRVASGRRHRTRAGVALWTNVPRSPAHRPLLLDFAQRATPTLFLRVERWN